MYLRSVLSALALVLSLVGACAQSPVTTYQSAINSAVRANGQGGITGPSLNATLQTALPIFNSMGTWDSGGKYSLSAAGGVMTGPLSLPLFTLTGFTLNAALYTDLFTMPPVTGVFDSNQPSLSIASSAGHLTGDSLRAMHYVTAQTQSNSSRQESLSFVDLQNKTGAVKSYVNSTVYSTGDYVHSADKSQTYLVTIGGTSASTGGGPVFTSGTGTSGTVSLSWFTSGLNDGKEAANEACTYLPGGGSMWCHASALTIQSGAFPNPGGSAINHEFDIANFDRDCPPGTVGACQIYGVYLNGIATGNKGTVGILGSTPGGYTGPANALYHWGMFLSPGFASDVGLLEQTGAATGIQQGGTNSSASYLNNATSPIAHNFTGVYSNSVINTTGATAPTTVVARAASQYDSYNGGSNLMGYNGSIGCLTYGTTNSGTTYAFASCNDGSLGIAEHLFSRGNAPTLSGCAGATLQVGSTDLSGTIIEGSACTGVTLTFVAAVLKADPFCVVMPWNANPLTAYNGVSTGFAYAHTSESAAKFTYHCMGN